ncbi:hypothetical protein L208DRAFT_269084 [Tricholoma matsutake]|nr:hypothetical protein L208DRAFT_269084 [Tricholoma matsutake 945]
MVPTVLLIDTHSILSTRRSPINGVAIFLSGGPRSPPTKPFLDEPEMYQPLSLFAQTMLEEDEKFYATFPEARRAAIEQRWRYQKALFSQYFEGLGFQYCPEPNTYTAAEHYENIPHSSDAYAACAADLCFPASYLEATFPRDTGYGYSASMASGAFPLESVQHEWTDQRSDWETMHPKQHYTAAPTAWTPLLMLPVSTQEFNYPSQQHLIDLSSNSLLCDDTLSPTLQPFDLITQTPNWQTDAPIVNDQLHALVPRYPCVPDARSLDASVVAPANRSRLTQDLQKARHSKSHPYIGITATPRPSRMCLSAPPTKRRAKKPTPPKPAQPKPPLACLFCRTRKIACGAPLAGSEKKTCSQCEKRGLHCSFPLESYRGVRNRQPRSKACKIPAKGVSNNFNSDVD